MKQIVILILIMHASLQGLWLPIENFVEKHGVLTSGLWLFGAMYGTSSLYYKIQAINKDYQYKQEKIRVKQEVAQILFRAGKHTEHQTQIINYLQKNIFCGSRKGSFPDNWAAKTTFVQNINEIVTQKLQNATEKLNARVDDISNSITESVYQKHIYSFKHVSDLYNKDARVDGIASIVALSIGCLAKIISTLMA